MKPSTRYPSRCPSISSRESLLAKLRRHFVDRGYFPEPTDWSESELAKIWVGHEMLNPKNTGASVSSLKIKKYEIEDISY